jgi:hypothetical protein
MSSVVAFLLIIGIFAIEAYRADRKRRLAVADAVAEYRVALDFIAEEFAEMPHEFAAIFLAGNRVAMEQKFPDYFDFRAASITQYLGQPQDDDA